MSIPDPTPDAPLFCYHDDSDWVIAHSPEDASVVWKSYIGDDHDNEEYPWSLWDRDLTIYMDDGKGSRKQTIAEWIAECGRSFLCSENF